MTSLSRSLVSAARLAPAPVADVRRTSVRATPAATPRNTVRCVAANTNTGSAKQPVTGAFGAAAAPKAVRHSTATKAVATEAGARFSSPLSLRAAV
jgi:hypothetical protein